MLATHPSARWSSDTSPSHLRVKARTSYRYAAVGAKICQSPVQPARSRCGQSVGMSQTFDRRDHTTASWSRLMRSSLQPNQPSLRRSECTTTPLTSPGSSGPGWPSTRTYRKPCVVNRGSNTSPPPAETTSSTCPSGNGSGMMGRSTSRCAVVRSPLSSSHSPCDRVSRRPAGPGSASRTHPLKFCPKSTTKAFPSRTGRTATGRICCTRRTGGATERTTATSTSRGTAIRHDRSSNTVSSMAGSCTAGSSSRRSSRWPPMRSAAVMWEGATRQPGWLAATTCHPCSVCTSNCARSATSSPYWSAARGSPTWPRYHPSASRTASTWRPGRTSDVTSYAWY